MNFSIKTVGVLAALIAVQCTFFDGASAQPAPDDNRLQPDRLRDALKERAKTRPRIAPPPLGLPPQRISAAPINWQDVEQAEARTRQRDAGAQRSFRANIGQAAEGLRRVPIDNLPRINPPEISRVLLPVLVPATPEILETVVVYGQQDAYTANAEVAEGVSLRMAGTRKKLVLPSATTARERIKELREKRPLLPGQGVPYVITRSVSSTDLSFSRFGAGYVLSLICDDPENDQRCAEDAFISSLVSSMALLNRKPAEEEGDDDE